MTSLRTITFSLLAILSLALSACGGGGGGEDNGGGLPPGADLPAITAVAPAPGTPDADVDSTIEIRFGTALDVGALPAQAITVVDDDGAVNGSVAYDAARRALVFTPSARLEHEMRHDVTLAAGITDVDGNARPNPFVFTFTTAPMRAGDPLPHENEALDTQLLGFTTNDTGIGGSFMKVDVALRHDVVMRMLDPVTGFGVQLDVDSFVDSIDAHPYKSIAINRAGKGIIAWRVGGSDVFAATFDAAAGIVGATRTLDASAETSGLPQVAIDQAGNAMAVWTQRATGADRKVWGAGYVAGSGWQTSINLEPNGGDTYDPQLGMGRFGQVVVAWTLEVGADFAARSRPWTTGGWSGIQTVSYTPGTRSIVEEVLVRSNNEATVLMTFANTVNPTYRGIRSRRYRALTLANPGWQALEVPTAEAGVHMTLDGSLLSGTSILLAWAADTNAAAKIEVLQYTDGGGWSAPIQITALTPTTFNGLSLRTTSRGDRHTMVDWGFNNGATSTRRGTLLFNTSVVYQDRILPVNAANSGRSVIDALGNVRYVSKAATALLETFVVEVNGTVGPVDRVDGATAQLIGDFQIAQSANGRGAILWDERPGIAGTPYDVMHVIID